MWSCSKLRHLTLWHNTVAADALALSWPADLEEIGLPLAAATTIAAHFGNVPEPEPEPDEPERGPDEPELGLGEPESEPEQDATPEPALETPSGPMAEFDEAAVQAWLGSVPGLTAAQRAAAAGMMAEDEYEGAELVGCTAKTLRRRLKGSAAEEAVPLLLAARDVRLAAELVQEVPAAAAPSCQICMEPYSQAGAVVPRMLVSCGHDFCEGCLDRMLRPLPAQKGRKRLPCPACRVECAVKGGRAAELPIVYIALQGR